MNTNNTNELLDSINKSLKDMTTTSNSNNDNDMDSLSVLAEKIRYYNGISPNKTSEITLSPKQYVSSPNRSDDILKNWSYYKEINDNKVKQLERNLFNSPEKQHINNNNNNNNLRDEIDNLQSDLKKMKFKNVNTEISQQKQQHIIDNRKMYTLQSENETLKNTIEELKSECRVNEQLYQNNIKTMEQRENKMQDECQQLQEKIEELELKNMNMNMKFKQVNEELAHVKAKNIRLTTNIEPNNIVKELKLLRESIYELKNEVLKNNNQNNNVLSSPFLSTASTTELPTSITIEPTENMITNTTTTWDSNNLDNNNLNDDEDEKYPPFQETYEKTQSLLNNNFKHNEQKRIKPVVLHPKRHNTKNILLIEKSKAHKRRSVEESSKHTLKRAKQPIIESLAGQKHRLEGLLETIGIKSDSLKRSKKTEEKKLVGQKHRLDENYILDERPSRHSRISKISDDDNDDDNNNNNNTDDKDQDNSKYNLTIGEEKVPVNLNIQLSMDKDAYQRLSNTPERNIKSIDQELSEVLSRYEKSRRKTPKSKKNISSKQQRNSLKTSHTKTIKQSSSLNTSMNRRRRNKMVRSKSKTSSRRNTLTAPTASSRAKMRK